MYIASNDKKKYMPYPGWKNYVFQNTLMTSHKCGATLKCLKISKKLQMCYFNLVTGKGGGGCQMQIIETIFKALESRG